MTTDFKAGPWHDFWHGDIGETVLTKSMSIALLIIGAVLAARFITWVGCAPSNSFLTGSSIFLPDKVRGMAATCRVWLGT